jgi:4-amino-4-deoxy-L-arabinose transferase-like glycosyltransferase
MLIFLGLTWCVLRVEQVAGDSKSQPKRLLGLAIAAGLLAGVGALTRYAFGWIIIPVALFLIFFGGQRRVLNTLAALGAFMLVLAPWIVRNFAVSGTPFGTAGFAIVEGTAVFPGFQLERSLHPDLSSALWLTPYVHKLLQNTRVILQDALPRLGGSWASLLFLVGLLLSFRSAAVRRMRYFLLMCLAVFIVVQALGRTQLSEESPEVNSENLLVLLAPLVFIYGVSLFLTLLDQMVLPVRELRSLVKIVFVGLCCAPMIFALLPPKTVPVVYPPYYPPDIQRAASWMERNELMMSDVPWAVAWYGQRQCAWLTMNAQDDFYAINDMKPVQALYLTPKTMDGKLLSDMGLGVENSWGSFIANALVQRQIPGNFPLRYAPSGAAAIGSGIFLTDGERWKTNQK